MGISDGEELDLILRRADVLDKVLTTKPLQEIIGCCRVSHHSNTRWWGAGIPGVEQWGTTDWGKPLPGTLPVYNGLLNAIHKQCVRACVKVCPVKKFHGYLWDNKKYLHKKFFTKILQHQNFQIYKILYDKGQKSMIHKTIASQRIKH